jgi:hypothetical protein
LRGYIITLYEIKAEPDYVIYMYACPLLDPFHKYLEISVVFTFMMFTATTNTTAGNENVLVGFFFMVRGGEYYKKGKSVSNCREDENICSHLCVGKNPYLHDVS